MGKLLSYLRVKENQVNVFIDFEKAAPSEGEADLHGMVDTVLKANVKIIDELKGYAGCGDLIRKAISTPSEETETAAWNAILPAVEQLKSFYDYSLELEKVFPKLLIALCKEDAKASLGGQQALAKQLADILDFTLRFDDAKMTNPAIQNDFSYYRRTLNRMKIQKKDMNISIRDELGNRMSLFFAYPTPMMKVLTDITVKFMEAEKATPRDNITKALALMANICQSMVERKTFESPATNLLCLRSMTGAIILFDHLHPIGAFSKKSPVNIRSCITTIRATPGTENLLNALRFTTAHLNDEETPENVKSLLA